jgi:hypothetical protein
MTTHSITTTPRIRPSAEQIKMTQSRQHETGTPGSAIATQEKRFMAPVSAALHSLKDRIGHAARPRIVPQRSSSRATEVRGQPIVLVEQWTITDVPSASSICGDEAPETRSGTSLCPICMNLNKLYEVAQSPANELRSAAALYENSSRGGCQGCTTVVRFLHERYSTGGVVLRPPADNETTFARLRALLTLYHTSKCMPVDRHVGMFVEISSHPSKCQCSGPYVTSSKHTRPSKRVVGNEDHVSNFWRHWIGSSCCMGTPRTRWMYEPAWRMYSS